MRARVLAVDNSERVLAAIRAELAAPDVEIATARTGSQALQQLGRDGIDVLLLGVDLGDAEGIELYRRLRRDERARTLPVVFLLDGVTAAAPIPDAGAVDFVVKPLQDLAPLRALVGALLEARRAACGERETELELAERLQHAERSLEAARGALNDFESLLAGRSDPTRALALFDGDLRLIEANEAFARLLDAGADAPAAGRALTGALRTRLTAASARFELVLGGVVHEVEADWVRPGGLLCVRVFDVSQVRAVRRRIDSRRTVEAHADRRPRPGPTYQIPGFVGSSPMLCALREATDLLRHQRVTVLVQGESGTGKELVSRALHFGGPDAPHAFIPIHCGAISPELIESELFGYVKGAFTGAAGDKQGLFSAADGGTIFLDEIAETSTDLQVKLLRVLQHREIRPVGATHPLHVDVRIVAATNKDLEERVRRGLFREDLFYRLEVVRIDIPPLRDRIEDVPELVEHFVAKCNRTLRRGGQEVRGVSRGALRSLCAYPWPGNVRELEHVIERAFALSAGDTIQHEHLPPKIGSGEYALRLAHAPARHGWITAEGAPLQGEPIDLKGAAEESQRRLIWRALELSNWDMRQAAARLNMPRSTFYRKCSRFGIRRPGRARREPAADA